MLLRVYGIGVDQLIDRENELAWIARLSHLNIGPSLLGVFANGRFEEYLPSRTLTSADMRIPDISCGIAACTRELHDIVSVYAPTEDSQVEVWQNIDKWYKVVKKVLPALVEKSEGWATSLNAYDLGRLEKEIKECKKLLSQVQSPIVFAQNDSQYGNVLQMNKTEELVIVDFDYAGYNPRGFDLANHFCEWMYDYHAHEPAAMNRELYPTEREQIRFLTAYLTTVSKFVKADRYENVTVEDLQKEVAMYTMVSHLSWGLWGLVQASQSEIDFDYFLYSTQRLDAFREELEKWRKQS
ncbi:kinase-like domain-containing protein [Sporodiniella umbellata]|nr:kinase-like domain-containing protein [Sporodiniella umbellata]